VISAVTVANVKRLDRSPNSGRSNGMFRGTNGTAKSAFSTERNAPVFGHVGIRSTAEAATSFHAINR
jgi:hypothetical protein